jgi:hypothetical protein
MPVERARTPLDCNRLTPLIRTTKVRGIMPFDGNATVDLMCGIARPS